MQLEPQQASLDANHRVHARIEIRPAAEHLNADLNFLGSIGASGETLLHREPKELGQARRTNERRGRKNAAQRSVNFLCFYHGSRAEPTYTTVKPWLFLLKSFIIAYCSGNPGALEARSLKKLLLLICAGTGALMAQTPTILGVYNATLESEGIPNTTICPGGIATIYGTGFGSGSTTSVVVLVGGQRSDVLAVAPTQVNVQLPFNAPVGATSVVITTGGGTSAPFNVTLAAVAPTIALASGSTTVGLFTTLKNTIVSSTNLANPGDTLVLYATGLGPTTPAAPVTGLATSNLPTATLPTLTIGGVAATVAEAAIAPRLAPERCRNGVRRGPGIDAEAGVVTFWIAVRQRR